jgi:hypothetical protein
VCAQRAASTFGDSPGCRVVLRSRHGSRRCVRPRATGSDPRPVSPLHELTGFYLTVDCLAPDRARERTFAVAASFYGGQRTVGEVLRRMRCSSGCGGRVGATWLVTGPILGARVRPRRVLLLGPETRE